MIRLLHTADVHLGRQFPSLRHKASDYRNQLLRTFEKSVDLAIGEKVSLMLIAGDLFDSNRIFGITVGKVLAAFRKLESSGVRVCVLPGTHDAFTDDSIYRSVRFPANVAIFTPACNQQTYTDLDLTVYGRAADKSAWGASPLKDLKLSRDSGFHIGMAHCSLKRTGMIENDAMILEPAEIGNSGLDYLALGHWHSFQDLSQGNTRACYSGSPEPVDMDQKGAGHVIMVSLRGKNNVELEPVRIGTKKIDAMTIDVSPFDSPAEIAKLIEGRADPNLVLEVTLTGLRRMNCDFNAEELETDLGNSYFCLRMIDRSQPKLDEIQPQNFPEKTVTGRFLRMMEDKIAAVKTVEDKPLYEEALRLGFALLQGRSQVIE